jgi:hypothetical protein
VRQVVAGQAPGVVRRDHQVALVTGLGPQRCGVRVDQVSKQSSHRAPPAALLGKERQDGVWAAGAERGNQPGDDQRPGVVFHIEELPQLVDAAAARESINSKIQWIKYTALGFRNVENFKNAIYFHCGGLDLSPQPT